MRVMRVLTRPNLGGPTVQSAALWHAHRALGVSTLLVVGRCGRGEAALPLEDLGIPRVDPTRVDGASEGFVEVPGLSNRWGPFGRLRAAFSIDRLVRRFAPDVVHTHTSAAGLLGRRAALAHGVRTIVHTFHGLVLRDYFPRPVSRLLVAMERRLAARTTRLIAVSASCRDELAELGVADRSRIDVVPPAVPLPAFASREEARAKLRLGPDEFAVAVVGRLVPVKRVEHFLLAVRQLPTTKGFVCGSGPLAGQLHRQAPPNVTFRAGSADLRRLLAGFDALVLPSRREGFPLVAVEAFAAGVPVVGYDVPGTRDAIGTTRGLLVPEGLGPDGLRTAIARIAADGRLAKELVAAGRRDLGRFAPGEIAMRLLTIYQGEGANR